MKADMVLTCEVCGREFECGREKKTCSRDCWKKLQSRNTVEQHKDTAIDRNRICKWCGKEFIMHTPGGKANRGEVKEGQFCSRRCRGNNKKWESRYSFGVLKSLKYYRVVDTYRKCRYCGAIYEIKESDADIKGKLCSRNCELKESRERNYQENKRKKELKPRECKQCKKAFTPEYGNKRKVFCSEFCSKKYAGKWNSGDARKRARKNGNNYEFVNPLKVFIRDGWRCQLCGKKLNKNSRGTFRDRAPELDHIIPLSQGGAHSYRNTQCACRKCNSIKSNARWGQQRLFG